MVSFNEIGISYLEKASKAVRKLLKTESIEKPGDLEKIAEQARIIDKENFEAIEVSRRPSNKQTLVWDISYVKKGVGILLDIKINEELG